jgi:hypothetical protein
MLKQPRTVTLLQRAEAAIDIQSDLRALKATLDAVMAQTVALNGKILTKRAEAHLPPIIGHSALACLAGANVAAVEGMSHVIEAHRLLTTEAGKLGLEVKAWGDIEDSGEIRKPSTGLRSVA